MNQQFPTHEKLKQKKEIDFLFAKGKWQTCGNLRIISVDIAKKPALDFTIKNQKFGVSVSKKFFKRAVDRNRIKRLLREVYRLNKEVYLQSFGTQTLAMILWISKEKPQNYHSVEENFKELCQTKK